jgi:hypothetical protein
MCRNMSHGSHKLAVLGGGIRFKISPKHLVKEGKYCGL